MMEKKNQASFAGKQLSRKEMKNLTGGLSTAGAGLWVCTKDEFDCYFTKSECVAACSIPTRCRLYWNCP
jgi:uncharacterized cupin superfamily protein